MEKIIESIIAKDLQPDDVEAVIFHDPCSDGRASELIARKFLSEKFPDKIVKYYPMSIGAYPPEGLENKNVLICDYSYRKDILDNLLGKVNKLLIIDHHLSAQQDLQQIDDKHKIFSMDYSGAMLTWFYFYKDLPPPLLIQYIQDRDLWTKKLPYTDDFVSWFYTLPLTYEEYIKYLDDDLLLQMIKLKGIAYRELNEINIKKSVDNAIPKFCKIKNKYYIVCYCNDPNLKSDIGNQIFNKYDLIDFSAVYSINDSTNSTSFSLRSTNKHSDVSEIAFGLGGGGHRNASGVKINYVTNYLPGKMFDNGEIYTQLDNVYYDILEMKGKNYDVVYMPSSVYEYELGTYLLQPKYKIKNKYTIDDSIVELDKDVQVCQCILNKKNNDKTYNLINFAIIYSYNIDKDITKFTIISHESIKSIDFGVNINNPIKLKGLHKKLSFDPNLMI